MNFTVIGQDGKPTHPEMGSYGIGVSRLAGAIIEANHDDKGIIWPESVAPFHISLINAKPSDEQTTTLADDLYDKLTDSGIEVLYDDTSNRAGAKFATADIIGSPHHIIVGRDATEKGLYEIKSRRTNERSCLTLEEIMDNFTSKITKK
jgi:prolyl-tRNA synthetase